jgi:hypothetical protein
MKEEQVATQRVAVMVFLVVVCLALPTVAQQSEVVTKGPIVIKEFKHDTGPLLREIAPLLPEFSLPSRHEIENEGNPNHPWSSKVQPDPVLQTEENSPSSQSPSFGVEFDGLGYGDSFFCNCMPPDNDGAAGTTQYVQYINLFYAVYNKSGTTLLGPLAGNSFWSGFGGSCQTDDSGDTIIRFDAAAQRWVVSQFALNGSGSDYECVAVSETSDATGAYYRYAFPFSDFPDYPKMGVWPDAYYFTFNNYNIAGTTFVGANACAANRTNMLAGSAATMVCFQQNSSQFGELPSDLDGSTPPATGTPNFFMELDPGGSANLAMFKFHVNFSIPADSTFTGPTLIPVAAFTPLCSSVSRNACVKQPTSGSDLLEGLSDRLMYRLVYRNFGDHTTLLVNHTIVAGSSSGVRWYEIHDPETSPTVFQSGTFAPDSQYRWMGAMAMDKSQDIAVGFSRSSSTAGDYPSIVYAGRVPTDPAGTLESEVVLKAGAGSQTSGYNRWGDYSSVTVDPTDDCTFWFTEEYEKTTGGFNWSTAIGSFKFPTCGAAGIFVTTGSMSVARFSFTATLLNNGSVLVTGGYNGSIVASAELYNPATGTFTLTGSMHSARFDHTATLLQNGEVLIAGGYYNGTYLSEAELYNPATGAFTVTGSMNTARYGHTATLLQNGEVLIAAGYNSSGTTAESELYNPATGTFTTTGSMHTARFGHTANLLQSGEVLLTGGDSAVYQYLSSAELYNPATGTFTLTGSMSTERENDTATLLQNGEVLVAGGDDGGSAFTSAELYNPATGTFTLTGSMNVGREIDSAALLSNGQVLIVGGFNSTGELASAELYNPATGVFTLTGSLHTARDGASATLLQNGYVLVAGGWNNTNGYLTSAELYQ